MKPSSHSKHGVDEVERTLHRLFIQAEGTSLRREDLQKAKELVPLLDEVARVARKSGGVLVDACAGKSPLGLVAAALALPSTWSVQIVERDPARVAAAKKAAAVVDRRVDVVAADINDDVGSAAIKAADVVVALHACGPASDGIIDAVVDSDVRHLLLVPCCYGAHPATHATHPIVGQQAAHAFVDVLPRQGVVGRRFAQAVIDSERTLRLESAGFDVDVVEFVGATVTPHNLLWRARRGLDDRRIADAKQRRARLLSTTTTRSL